MVADTSNKATAAQIQEFVNKPGWNSGSMQSNWRLSLHKRFETTTATLKASVALSAWQLHQALRHTCWAGSGLCDLTSNLFVGQQRVVHTFMKHYRMTIMLQLMLFLAGTFYNRWYRHCSITPAIREVQLWYISHANTEEWRNSVLPVNSLFCGSRMGQSTHSDRLNHAHLRSEN